MWELLLNRDHYDRLVRELIPAAQKFVWIATADLKDMHVKAATGAFRPFLGVLADLVAQGVEIRLLHAKEPGPRFRRDFDVHPELRSERFERVLCPRLHTKAVIIDARLAYIGSANFTGAGLGSKNENRRNFEAGILTDDRPTIRKLMQEIDRLFLGEWCGKCQLRDVCPDPIA
jgi:phosphatidylserine/phosphatidylglycerophosphate/cardiolipin synthase-like enzyme